MRRALLISLVACLVTIHQARLIDRCDLAKLLHQEDMDGFEGYSLSDCECHFPTTLICSPGHALTSHAGDVSMGLWVVSFSFSELLRPDLLSTIHCARKIVSGTGGMKNWAAWRMHCSGRPPSYWMTGCHLG
nr:PREDICTED: lysozyme-like protein 6 [Rhinolophus sinicus]